MYPYVADVVWHACLECGTEWPFPLGIDGYAPRAWRCTACADEARGAEIAALKKELSGLLERLGA
jgi:hypothetical protein